MNQQANTTRAAAKPRIRRATPAEIAAYEAAVKPLMELPVGAARTQAVFNLRDRMGIFVNFAHGKQYTIYNR